MAKDFFTLSIGRLRRRSRDYGSPVQCFVCGKDHKAFGVGCIEEDGRSETNFPLCAACIVDRKRTTEAITRKIFDAPDLVTRDCGEASAEQIRALIEKQNEPEQ
jgi:hypothetical protein